MFSRPICGRCCSAILASGLLLFSVSPGREAPFARSPHASDAAQTVESASTILNFVRVFSSAEDIRPSHPVLDRTIDIIAGPADPVNHVSSLQLPSAVTTDSTHRVFVADPGAKAIHVFDFVHSKYARLEGSGERLQSPISLAVDGQDNLYVVDQSSRTVLVYDSAGKFRRYLGKLRGGESYFDTPAGIAIDQVSGRIYVSDRQSHLIFVMDKRGKLIRKLGSRGGGSRPGDFRFPTQVVFAGNELFVLDAGNTRLQVLDTGGRFSRAVILGYVDQHTGLAVDSLGRIYVSDPALNQIQIFRRDGQPLYRFDPSTIKDANFSHPAAMWIEAGHLLYAVDSQSNRIALFQINGETAPH
ncbi:MAG: 6-bladed beta-propeller [Candidatus Sulfotelmatobacter sp.]